MGLANRKSVAWAIGHLLMAAGARVAYSVRSEERLKSLLGKVTEPLFVCDVEKEADVASLAHSIRDNVGPLDGIVHSIAFANYTGKPFHETPRRDFLQAMQISAFSLVEVSNALKPLLNPDASVVAIGISSQVTAESYGYMAPVKAALDSCIRFLAQSFSADTRVRFNTVNAGPLKTSASAGIPGFLDNYLFAEQLTFRKKAVQTEEVAKTALFLLSTASSGINAQAIVVNAGMDINYFDKTVVSAFNHEVFKCSH